MRPGWRSLLFVSADDPVRLAKVASRGADGVIALVETARRLAAPPGISAPPQVIGLALGTEDLALDMGVPPAAALLDLPSRQLALAAHAEGIMAFAGPIFISVYAELDAFRAAASLSRAYGNNGA